MSKLIRTTITLPAKTYKQARLIAGSKDISLSGYIAQTLDKQVQPKEKPLKKSSLGIFKLNSGEIYKDRSDLYENRLKSKIRN